MAIAIAPTAYDLGRTFARAVEADPAAERLWASAQRDGFHLWLLVAPVEAAAERRLYALSGMLYERFPGTDFQLHVLNPRHYPHGAEKAVPAGADEIPLHAG